MLKIYVVFYVRVCHDMNDELNYCMYTVVRTGTCINVNIVRGINTGTKAYARTNNDCTEIYDK